VLVDLRSLDNQVLRTSPNAPRLGTVWIATGDAERAATGARQIAGPDAVVTTASGTFVSRFMSSAVVSLWLGTAGCAALALVALGAAIAALLRRRRGEVIVLRAVGMGAREQARSRRAEVLGVVLTAAVFGLAGGVTVFLLAGNALARLSVVTAPSTLAVQGRVDLPGLFAALGAVGGAIGLVLWFYGGAVRRQVADTAYREETR
jgi:ABC-type antimicrobial peptide transport system permease subunit